MMDPSLPPSAFKPMDPGNLSQTPPKDLLALGGTTPPNSDGQTPGGASAVSLSRLSYPSLPPSLSLSPSLCVY